MDARAAAIFEFWFGRPDDADYGDTRAFWFQPSAAVDEDIRRRFLADHEKAAAGDYDTWQADPLECLSLILLLDQFPRNMFRGTPRSFATDAWALAVADGALARGHDSGLRAVERLFYYLPFEHSERLADQRRCVALMRALDPHPDRDEWIDYAVQHLELIERFGRFPHRNAIVGRQSTAAEQAYLDDSGATFGTRNDCGR